MEKSNRYFTGLIAVCAACLILTASCTRSPVETNVGFTAGRASATVIAVIGLVSVIIGGPALRGAGRVDTGGGRTGALTALVLGLIAVVLSVVHLGGSTGGFGTGGGRAGAIAALVLGLIGVNLGGLSLARARRSRSTAGR